jgi:hypothetical protein
MTLMYKVGAGNRQPFWTLLTYCEIRVALRFSEGAGFESAISARRLTLTLRSSRRPFCRCGLNLDGPIYA